MFTFGIAKKIVKEKNGNENNLIVERTRRERALNTHYLRLNSNKHKNRIFLRNEKSFPS